MNEGRINRLLCQREVTGGSRLCAWPGGQRGSLEMNEGASPFP